MRERQKTREILTGDSLFRDKTAQSQWRFLGARARGVGKSIEDEKSGSNDLITAGRKGESLI